MRKYALPLLALLGLAFTLFMIYRGAKQSPIAPIIHAPPISPYDHFVAGIGMIESVYKNIPIGIPIVDIITDIYVKVGDIVTVDTPLFSVDTRNFRAQYNEAEEYIRYAKLNYEDKKAQFNFYERLKEKTAVSEQVFTQAFYDKELARQQVENAKGALNVIQTNIDRSTVRSPIQGEVLQLNIRIGQVATTEGYNNKPLILFGDTTYYHLRIDIDEEDAWRIVPGAPARAFVRGNSAISFPLEYVYTEPYIIAKTMLTGSNTERVDTRILQIVYRFTKDNYPIYAGEILDVFVEALPNEGPGCT